MHGTKRWCKHNCARSHPWGAGLTIALLTLATAAVPRAAAETLNQSVVATIAVGTNPVAIVANPVTNKIYVANQGSNTVTVIDGPTNATSTIPVGAAPLALAINTVTDKIYVVNSGSANVTVIDGATGSTSTIATASGGRAVAVNSATNQIFVANPAVVTEIDGATGNTSSIASEGALGIAVDMANNRLYTCGFLGIQVIDVTSQSVVATIKTASATPSLAIVNPAMHQAYFGAPDLNFFDVLDTDTNLLIIPSGIGAGGGGTLALDPSTNQVVLAATSVSLYDAPTNTETLFGSLGLTWNISAINPVTDQVYLAANNTVAGLDGGNNYALATTLTTGGSPSAIAVNPLTDLVYVANSGANNVTVVSGASNVTTIFSFPGGISVDVNPLTNKGYIASDTNTLLVIDGETNAVTSVPVGQGPGGTLVNARSNKIYTLNLLSDSITAVDGVTLATTNVPTGKSPEAGVVNPLTDKVYAGNADGSVTVLDGATNSVTNLNVGGPNNDLSARGIAVNVIANQIYLVDPANSALKVVSGATNAVTSYPVGASPAAVAVNPVANLIYVANSNGNSVTVIDGATGAISTVQLPFSPTLVAVNPYTNLIYAAGAENTQLAVAVIDGVTSQPTINRYPVTPNFFGMLSVDTVTNRIYVAQSADASLPTVAIDGATNALLLPSQTITGSLLSANALAIDPVHERVYGASITKSGVLVEEPSQSSPLIVTIDGLTGNQTLSPTPAIMLTAVDGLTPGSPPVENVYYRFDTLAGPQSLALRNADGSFTATPAAPLLPGFHVLVAWAANGRENTVSSSNFFNGDSPLISPIARYGFYVVPATSITITTQGPSYQLFVGGTEQLLATATLADGSSMDVTNTASWSSSIPQDAVVSAGLVDGRRAGSVSISAAIGGLTASTVIPVMPATYQLNVSPAISKDGNGNYVVQIALTNQGDVNLSNVALTSAQLNTTAGPLPAPIASLAVGANANLQVIFPSSAGASKSTALLRLSGRYAGVIPGGTPQKGTFSANYRIALP